MTYPKLDWQRRFDPRSLNYTVRKQVGPNLRTRTCMWKRSLWLDQGQEGACTGFGFSHVLGTTPRKYVKQTIDDAFARHRYERAKQCDEWPGEDYDGSSVLGAMQAGKQDGLVSAYSWCTTMDEIKHAVSYLGPIEIGIDWYESMFDVDSEGFVRIGSSQIAGGHAIQVGGIDVTKGAFRLDNSWGKDWGRNGSAWITFTDMEQLLHQQGEFCLPKKYRP